ncbi:MAG: pepsin/retropepsin-like aspartic protease family protein [Dehalococcoidia bacterium]
MAVTAVESDEFPYLPITVTVQGAVLQVTALLDTGFDGDVVLPESLLSDSGIANGYRSWELAGGSVVNTPVYYGTVQIGDLAPEDGDIVILGSEAIVGRGFTDRYRVILDRGQRVTVEV